MFRGKETDVGDIEKRDQIKDIAKQISLMSKGDVIEMFRLTVEEQARLLDAYRDDHATVQATMNAHDWVDAGKVAKMLNMTIGGRNKLLAFLRDIGMLRSNNEPYQVFVGRGLCKSIWTEKEIGYETRRIPMSVFSMKGIAYIRKELEDHGYEHKPNKKQGAS